MPSLEINPPKPNISQPKAYLPLFKKERNHSKPKSSLLMFLSMLTTPLSMGLGTISVTILMESRKMCMESTLMIRQFCHLMSLKIGTTM